MPIKERSLKHDNIIKAIIDNWTVKVLCLAIAVAIYVFHTVSLLEIKTFDIPLTVINDGVMVPINQLPETVRVSIKTTKNNVALINPATMLHSSIYLTDLTQKGEVTLPIKTTFIKTEGSSENLDLTPLEITVHPESVQVTLDEKASKYIPIEPLVYGSVDKEYILNTVRVTPSNVKVTGAKSIIDSLPCVYTSNINIRGAKASLSAAVTLNAVSPLVKVEAVEEYKATVVIEKRTTSKVFERMTVDIRNLDDTFIIENALPLVSIEVVGSKKDIELLRLPPHTLFIDCSGISNPGEYDLAVNWTLSPKYQVRTRSVDKVHVSVRQNVTEESEEEGTEDTEEEAEEVEVEQG